VRGNYNATEILARPKEVEKVRHARRPHICSFFVGIFVGVHRLQSGREFGRYLSDWYMTIKLVGQGNNESQRFDRDDLRK
jgi:hypothetical protein